MSNFPTLDKSLPTLVKGIILSALLLVHTNSSVSAAACVEPGGIDDGVSGISTTQIQSLLNGKALGKPLPYLFLPLVDDLIGTLVTSFETPIQFRTALYHGNACYNAAAMYHPTALDIWGRDHKRICTDKFPSPLEKKIHEEVALAYTFAYSAITLLPSLNDVVTNLMDNVLNLPMSNLMDGTPDIGTPWGLAKATVNDMANYAKSDGWNFDGSMTHDFNKMPFSDFDYKEYSKYKVSPSSPLDRRNCADEKWNWEPLLESDGNGYFTKQEHVTPFAGFTARLYGMTTSEYESFTIPEPDYDYCQEARFVLSETKKMSKNDMKKVEIEVFDSKFTSILPMQIFWSIENGVSLFEFWFMDMALVTAMYDATILVWREKVVHNAVRPTTVVHALKGDEEIETYAGPFVGGAEMIKGFDWLPYIRTMPVSTTSIYLKSSLSYCAALLQ